MSPAGGRSPADDRAGLTRVVDDRTDETIGPMKGRSVHGSGVMRPRAAVAHRSRGEAQRRCRPSQRTARMILLRGARQPHGGHMSAQMPSTRRAEVCGPDPLTNRDEWKHVDLIQHALRGRPRVIAVGGSRPRPTPTRGKCRRPTWTNSAGFAERSAVSDRNPCLVHRPL